MNQKRLYNCVITKRIINPKVVAYLWRTYYPTQCSTFAFSAHHAHNECICESEVYCFVPQLKWFSSRGPPWIVKKLGKGKHGGGSILKHSRTNP
jgi:hypothetical protein